MFLSDITGIYQKSISSPLSFTVAEKRVTDQAFGGVNACGSVESFTCYNFLVMIDPVITGTIIDIRLKSLI